MIDAKAQFTSGPIDVTQVATYTALSGGANVFGVSSGGTITANGNGVDLLDVSYGGVTATASIAVGPCIFALNPSNQIVPYTGGTVSDPGHNSTRMLLDGLRWRCMVAVRECEW